MVAYYRVSTDRQGRSGLGLDAQRDAVQGYAGRQGLLVIEEFIEVESGKRADRPQLRLAMASARRHRAVLVIAKLDRLARSVAFIANLMEAGVDFVAVDMPLANRLTIHILAAVAEHEREMISARTKAALAVARARGQKLGWSNPARTDQQIDAARKGASVNKLTAHRFAENVAPVIDQIMAAGVKSAEEIAHILNTRGIATARGGRWWGATVRNVRRRVG